MPAAPPPHDDNPADVKALDLLMSTLLDMNRIDPDNEHGGDTRYCLSVEGSPYWHVEQAARKAAAHLVGGNQRRAEQLVYAMINDGVGVRTRPVLARLRAQWAADDPVGDAVHRMIMRTELPGEADVIRWAAVRAGLMWPCGDGNCRYHNPDAVDECQSCGKPRPTPA